MFQRHVEWSPTDRRRRWAEFELICFGVHTRRNGFTWFPIGDWRYYNCNKLSIRIVPPPYLHPRDTTITDLVWSPIGDSVTPIPGTPPSLTSFDSLLEVEDSVTSIPGTPPPLPTAHGCDHVHRFGGSLKLRMKDLLYEGARKKMILLMLFVIP